MWVQVPLFTFIKILKILNILTKHKINLYPKLYSSPSHMLHLSYMLILPLLLSSIMYVTKEYWSITQFKTIIFFFSNGIFIYSLFFLFFLNKKITSYQFIEKFNIVYPYPFEYTIAIDGLSIYFIVITAFLTSICLLVSWESPKFYIKEYFLVYIILEFLLLNLFSTVNLLSFYIIFEILLIPMFLLIGIWGLRERKIKAAYMFYLYTYLGSLAMFVAILYIWQHVGTTNIILLSLYSFEYMQEYILFVCIMFSFWVKVPIIPFHGWLPEAHVEAPTSGSILLAGILLKIATYGMLRFLFPLFPEASVYYSSFIITFNIGSMIYAGFLSFRQDDMKKIIAYSSIVHMNYLILGLYSCEVLGWYGSLLTMISHSFVAGGLFLCVGIVYDRYKTRSLRYYRGLIHIMPVWCGFFFLFILGNIAFPGTLSFIGEVITGVGFFNYNKTFTFVILACTFINLVYSILLLARISFLNIDTKLFKQTHDVSRREFFLLAILLLFVFYFGILPQTMIDVVYTTLITIFN